jgi:hypothetical protein
MFVEYLDSIAYPLFIESIDHADEGQDRQAGHEHKCTSSKSGQVRSPYLDRGFATSRQIVSQQGH